jgi:CRP-like cAMP-binding protein
MHPPGLLPDTVSDSPATSAGLAGRVLRLVQAEASLQDYLVDLDPADALLEEGRANGGLFILLEGEIALLKTPTVGDDLVRVSTHRPGDLLGVNSCLTGEPAFCTARALTSVRCLKLSAAVLHALPQTHPELHRLLQRLVVANLSSRYRSAVRLQIRLLHANRELAETRNLLLHRDRRPATDPGKPDAAVTAPLADIRRHRDATEDAIRRLLELGPGAETGSMWPVFWSAGIAANATEEVRPRLSRLGELHPLLPRKLLRRLALVPEKLWPHLLPPQGATTFTRKAECLLAIFETAQALSAQQNALDRLDAEAADTTPASRFPRPF